MDQVRDIHHPMDQAKDIMGAPKKVAKETVMDQVRDIQEDHTKRVVKDIVMDQVKDIVMDQVKDIVMDQVKDIHHPMDQAKDIMGAPKKVAKDTVMGLAKDILDVPTVAMFIEIALRKFKMII